ncbi:MAG: AAA family ATPase, partial [Candidatus Omnitrophica bacterium]|nr:AAA family ATPase [Candidatus Omnitrophota bacterium]
SEEFSSVFDTIENTGRSIFLTGKAGTGKSTFIQYFRQKTRKNIVVLAPTGVAAIKARGQTIHSFFRLPPRFIQEEHIKRLRNSDTMRRVDTIVIDEASMIRADILDGIDRSLRVNRGRYDEPFGGVQMVLIGDLFQLPPVVDREMSGIMSQRYDTPYFFSANVLKDTGIRCFELTKIYRQKSMAFINILNKIRIRDITERDIDIINTRCRAQEEKDGVVTLTVTNIQAKNINDAKLGELENDEYGYEAEVTGKFDRSAYPADHDIRLKKGAQVILIKNDPQKRWVNGTLGEIYNVFRDKIEIRIEGEIYELKKEKWENISYIYDRDTDKIEEEVTGSFSQYPLKLAWAITIHKSQGQTFSRVNIDVGRGAFAHGQVYVALSRCRDLDGITLTRPISARDIIFDERVYEFMDGAVRG